LADAPELKVAGCWGEGKEGQKLHQLKLQQLIKDGAVGLLATSCQPKGVHTKGKQRL